MQRIGLDDLSISVTFMVTTFKRGESFLKFSSYFQEVKKELEGKRKGEYKPLKFQVNFRNCT